MDIRKIDTSDLKRELETRGWMVTKIKFNQNHLLYKCPNCGQISSGYFKHCCICYEVVNGNGVINEQKKGD